VVLRQEDTTDRNLVLTFKIGFEGGHQHQVWFYKHQSKSKVNLDTLHGVITVDRRFTFQPFGYFE
jgi:hypothetical protein